MPVLILAVLLAQPTAEDEAIRRHLAVRAAALEREFLPEVKSAADFEAMRPRLREEYFYMLGLSPMPERTPLNVTVTGRLERPECTIEKLHYQSRPGLYVTANLYLPKTPGRHPAILYACGHSNRGRDGNKTAYQDHGLWFASHGYVCLVVDTLQLGEIAAIHHGTYREQRWGWHDRGYTSAGVECWNGIRGIDLLVQRPDVDPERIGVTGISGGGAATFWISAADERVKACVPVSGMADLGYYAGQDGVNGHCDCMFLHNAYRWNWTTIAALVCPRPMLFMNSDADRIFPMDANERVINRLERLYARFGAGDRVDAVVSVGGHAYRTDLRRAAFEFFNRLFKGDARPVEDADAGLAAKIPGKDLRVFPEDADIPAGQKNTTIDESFVPVARPPLPEEGGFEAWRDGLLQELRKVTFGAFPTSGYPDRPAASELQTFAGSRFLLVLGPDEEPGPWAEPYRAVGRHSNTLRLRGRWSRKNPPNTVERSLVLLGSTADSERAGDVAAVLDRLGSDWTVVGRGETGIIAAYGALLSRGGAGVIVVDPPKSHREGPHFLNVLRVWDIPEALGALAPRRLILQTKDVEAFQRTEEIYRRAGSAERFSFAP